MIFRWCVAGERNGAIFSSSLEKPKSGTKQDEKSFPSSTSFSSVHISLWWKIHSSCGLYPFVYFWQHFIFAAVPCSLFHHFLLNKINNYVEWTQRKFLNCFTAEIFFIEPIFFLSKYRDENLMIMVGRWKALKNVKAEIVFQSRINWLGHMTLGTKEDCLGNISISICRLKKAGFLSFLLVRLNLQSLLCCKGLSGLSSWKHLYHLMFNSANMHPLCATFAIIFLVLYFVPSSSSLHSVDQRNGSNIPGLITTTSFFWLCFKNISVSWA